MNELTDEELKIYMMGYDVGYTHGYVTKNIKRLKKAIDKENLYTLNCDVCGVPVVDFIPTKDDHIVSLKKRSCWGDSAAGYQFCKDHIGQADEARKQREFMLKGLK